MARRTAVLAALAIAVAIALVAVAECAPAPSNPSSREASLQQDSPRYSQRRRLRQLDETPLADTYGPRAQRDAEPDGQSTTTDAESLARPRDKPATQLRHGRRRRTPNKVSVDANHLQGVAAGLVAGLDRKRSSRSGQRSPRRSAPPAESGEGPKALSASVSREVGSLLLAAVRNFFITIGVGAGMVLGNAVANAAIERHRKARASEPAAPVVSAATGTTGKAGGS